MTYTIAQWICNLIVFGTVLYLIRDITRPLLTRLVPIEKRMEVGFFKFQRKITLIANIVFSLLAVVGFHFACGEFVEFWLLQQNNNPSQNIQQFQILSTPVDFQKDSIITPNIATVKAPVFEEVFYLQIAAFSSLQRAEIYAARWKGHSTQHVWIAVAAYESIPYKVVLGPFPSRKAAGKYGAKLQVSNFPRSAEGLQVR